MSWYSMRTAPRSRSVVYFEAFQAAKDVARAIVGKSTLHRDYALQSAGEDRPAGLRSLGKAGGVEIFTVDHPST